MFSCFLDLLWSTGCVRLRDVQSRAFTELHRPKMAASGMPWPASFRLSNRLRTRMLHSSRAFSLVHSSRLYAANLFLSSKTADVHTAHRTCPCSRVPVSYQASVAHLSSHLQRVAPLYARFLAEFDASFALAGRLLIELRASGDDKCYAIDAFVEPVRHIETYRSIVRILVSRWLPRASSSLWAIAQEDMPVERLLALTPALCQRDATPEAHGSRSMIVQAGHLAHALPVPPCTAEDLVKLRRLSRCLVPDPSSLSPSSNAIHDPQYRAIFSLIRLDRKTIKEGTLHLTALRGQSTIFARAGFGPSTPVVVVLLSDIFLILTQCSFGMRVHEKCELRASSIEATSSEDSHELTVWCAGVRHVLLAASPDERRAWAQLLQITISSACETAARTPLQVVAPVSRAYQVGIKHGPPMMFAGPTPKNKRGAGDAAHAIDFAYMNMTGGNASTSDGEFEWETDNEEEEHVLIAM